MRPDKAAIAGEYYKMLLPELHKIPGFINETPLGSPSNPDKAVEVAAFENEEAIKRWRNESNHLRIQGKASHGVYESYRIRIGPTVDDDHNESVGLADEHQYIILYQCDKPDGSLNSDASSLISTGAPTEIKEYLLDSSVYHASQAVWISTWSSGFAASKFERLIDRVPGDIVKRIRVMRDYTKVHRKDAPSEEPGSR